MNKSPAKDDCREQWIEQWLNDIKPYLEKLLNTWNERRLYNTTKHLYLQQAKKHVEDLMNEMIAESEDKNQSLAENIKHLGETLHRLSKELDKKVILTGYENLPFDDVQEKLSEQVENLKLYKEELQKKFKQLQQREFEICKKLGVMPINLDKKIPNEKDLENFALYLNIQEKEKNRLDKVFYNIRDEIMEMMLNLQMTVENEFQRKVFEDTDGFIYTEDNMKMLKEWESRLKGHLQQIEQRVQEKREETKALWLYLEEPAHYCQEFLTKHSDNSATTYKAFEKEIERCKEKRTENITKYVGKIRAELENLWDLCKYSEEQRNNFVPIHCQTYTDNLLNLHEMEAERLRKFYNDNRKIFDLITDYEGVIEQMKVLDRRAMDPDRLHNRGGQLLAEEKERKAANKKLPKLLEQITALVQDYESIHGESFTFYGLTFEQYSAKIMDEYTKEKENIKNEVRKQAKDKSTKKTPLSTTKRTPSAQSIRQVIDQSKSVKRKLLDESASSATSKMVHASGEKSRKRKSANYLVKRGKFGSKRSFNNSGKSGKNIHKSQRLKKNEASDSLSSSYEQFQEHLEQRDDLRSSCLPAQFMQFAIGTSKMKTPVKTPAKPLRKVLRAAETPKSSKILRPTNISVRKLTPSTPNTPGTPGKQSRSSSRSPKPKPHLTVAPSNMPIFL